MYRDNVICIEGPSAIGKTSLMNHIEKEKLGKICKNDYFELSHLESKYKNKDVCVSYQSMYILNSILNCENKDDSKILFVDRSPLSSVFYDHIFHIMKSSSINNLKSRCMYFLTDIFSTASDMSHIQIIAWNIINKFKIVLFNCKNVEHTAELLLSRKTALDEAIAHKLGYDFNYEFCKWYVRVQYEYFLQLKNIFKNEIIYYEVNDFNEMIEPITVASKKLYDDYKINESLNDMFDFKANDKKKRPKNKPKKY